MRQGKKSIYYYGKVRLGKFSGLFLFLSLIGGSEAIFSRRGRFKINRNRKGDTEIKVGCILSIFFSLSQEGC